MKEWEERGGLFGPVYSTGGNYGHWTVERTPGTDEWVIKFTERDGPYLSAEAAMKVAESWEQRLNARPLVTALDLPVLRSDDNAV